MRYIGALIGAAVGGLVGAAIWAAVAFYTNFEIGWIAWGIGVLAGFGAMAGAKGEGDLATGGLAAIAALAGVGLGKFGAIHFAVDKEMNSPAFQAHLNVTDEDMIVVYADQVVEEWETANKAVNWPQNVIPEEAQAEADYPKPVWAEAKKRWTGLNASEQETARNEQTDYRKQMTEFVRASIKGEAFKESFGPFDILWAVLALASAFGIGRGAGGGDD